ncbi:MAG TPA: membrane protein insertion efficiency factor YidD [Actinomycetota bacterium]|nr:membrane protein insertion efficiency factor YidD [Actinomycetota bacterium]
MVGRALVGVISVYQRFVSPILPPRCRFVPSCSTYAVDAIREYGPALGVWMGVKRILRCHPFTPGGFDPVPRRQ